MSQPRKDELQRAGTFNCPNCGYHAWVWGLPPENIEPEIKWRTCSKCLNQCWGSVLEPDTYHSKYWTGSEHVRCDQCGGKGFVQDN